ncbi:MULTISPECIES: biotin--[acetyl-CoA-carboxylase] ligase [unclassified Flavobacterium]|uniref:biotin--[acetyl-CoA-carboxylase] ligase n=1 Tax=unclassified Flavobacterium TaxID=196869 RepID=UPI000869DDD6|nr:MULTISPECIES: biotin--[acetyl-CoA-carboxylase] ligase [unclassified Flavobacterium]MBN9285759.1 biotin--[acetyl-CoA-carboxylase] ligase [Flavobacterium sp.]ODS84839.1 MAG: biotin--[acetyl-CoA-carboxylase] ligase [Chryseobacterium sp. SCN 40-13]OJV70360.1 MAG: biotin--[acetyl-CoA-carboxylase] ligase [Flavobacterium sp. 40-81]
MNIIKLGATSSTNDFLKDLLTKQFVENYTVIIAENQTKGKGQMGSEWNVESGKNLTFSVLIKDLLLDINAIFHLNVAVAISIVEALESLNIPGLFIKWPNDILAENKKIGGILIENSIKPNGEIFSIVGIGLNVNQKNFKNLPKASSLLVITGKEFDKETVFVAILENLKRNMALLRNKEYSLLWEVYDKNLFKKGVPMPFETDDHHRFMGIIKGVTSNGKLEVLLEDDSVKTFDIKEVRLLY